MFSRSDPPGFGLHATPSTISFEHGRTPLSRNFSIITPDRNAFCAVMPDALLINPEIFVFSHLIFRPTALLLFVTFLLYRVPPSSLMHHFSAYPPPCASQYLKPGSRLMATFPLGKDESSMSNE